MTTQTKTTWQKVKLGEIIDPVLGGTPSRAVRDYWNGNINWISIQDIISADGRYIRKTAETISEDGLKNSPAKVLSKGSVIISARGTIGELAMLAEPMAFNQSCYGLVLKNPKEINQIYFFYALQDVIRKAKRIAHGGVFDTFTKDTFNHIDFKYPEDPSTQKRIADVLSAFDDKIELNNKISRTLEQMAQAIFKEWFVNPTGKEIPLLEVADFVNGGAFGSVINRSGRGIPLVKIAELNRGVTENTEWIDRAVSNKYYINDGDLLFSWSGTVDVFIWAKGRAVLNQHIFNVIPKASYSRGLLYYAIKSKLPFFKQMAGAKATTMGHIKKEHLAEQNIVIPQDRNLGIFDDFYKTLVNLQLKNQKLASLRDSLLPKLMSGEIRI